MIDSDIINGIHLFLIAVKPEDFKETQELLTRFEINLIEYLVLEFEGDKYYPMRPFDDPMPFVDCFGAYNHVYNMDFFISKKSSEEWKNAIYQDRDLMIEAIGLWQEVMNACIEKFGVFKMIPDFNRGDEMFLSAKEIKFDEWTDLDFLKMGEERIIVVKK